jgi:hypothetical protein
MGYRINWKDHEFLGYKMKVRHFQASGKSWTQFMLCSGNIIMACKDIDLKSISNYSPGIGKRVAKSFWNKWFLKYMDFCAKRMIEYDECFYIRGNWIYMEVADVTNLYSPAQPVVCEDMFGRRYDFFLNNGRQERLIDVRASFTNKYRKLLSDKVKAGKRYL